jgi:hypothetical protein
MAPWLPQILPPVWQTLTCSADIYLKTIVNGTEEVDEIVDSDGELIRINNIPNSYHRTECFLRSGSLACHETPHLLLRFCNAED